MKKLLLLWILFTAVLFLESEEMVLHDYFDKKDPSFLSLGIGADVSVGSFSTRLDFQFPIFSGRLYFRTTLGIPFQFETQTDDEVTLTSENLQSGSSPFLTQNFKSFYGSGGLGLVFSSSEISNMYKVISGRKIYLNYYKRHSLVLEYLYYPQGKLIESANPVYGIIGEEYYESEYLYYLGLIHTGLIRPSYRFEIYGKNRVDYLSSLGTLLSDNEYAYLAIETGPSFSIQTGDWGYHLYGVFSGFANILDFINTASFDLGFYAALDLIFPHQFSRDRLTTGLYVGQLGLTFSFMTGGE